MDSFEWNKIFGAILGSILFVLVIRVAAEAAFHVPPLDKPAYVVEGVEHEGEAAPATAGPQEEALPDFATAIPAADLAAGEAAAAKCAACHVWTEGTPHTIGPNLHGVVGRAKTATDFDYSPALRAKGGEWSYDELFRFLRAPPAVVPGTKMLFAGVPRTQERIDLIAFLRMQAAAPAPLPPPRPAEAAPVEAAAPAEGAPAEAAPTAEAPAH